MNVFEAPTEKQYDYAKAISDELEIPLPIVFSKKAYSEYIDNYKNKYKVSLQKYHDEEEYEED